MNQKITRIFQGLTITSFLRASFNSINGLKAREKMNEIVVGNDEMMAEQINKLNGIAKNLEVVDKKVSELNLSESLVSLVRTANEKAKMCDVKLKSVKEA
jgi:hypothetical protein